MSVKAEAKEEEEEEEEEEESKGEESLEHGGSPSKRMKMDASPSIAARLLELEEELCCDLASLRFPPPVTHIYNPLSYAAEPHRYFVHRYGNGRKKVVFLGMNPGPFGMAQNGVPFGESQMVREWLGVAGHVGRPAVEHPKRAIVGLDCPKKEVSGSRFWGFFRELCGSPERFFAGCYVHNYCPLCFMAESGRNVTPPEMKADIRRRLEAACDRSLVQVVRLLGAECVVGVGKYPQARTRAALASAGDGGDVRVEYLSHPSPANAAANRGWADLASRQLEQLGLMPLIAGATPATC